MNPTSKPTRRFSEVKHWSIVLGLAFLLAAPLAWGLWRSSPWYVPPSKSELLDQYEAAESRGDHRAAIRILTKLLRTEEGFVFYALRADAYEALGAWEEAVADLSEAIQRHPGISEDAFELSELYRRRAGIQRVRQEPPAAAIADLERAVLACPRNWMAHNDLAYLHLGECDADAAIAAATEGIEHMETDAMLYHARGLAYSQSQRNEQALADFERAASTWNEGPVTYDEKDAAGFYAELGGFLAMCPDQHLRDGPRAYRLAHKACELSLWEDGHHLSSLAAAYAENGDFENAVKWQRAAIAKTESGPVRQWHEKSLELLLAEKPLHNHGEAFAFVQARRAAQ